ncbi:MAG: type transport system ATP-binding protein [Frankiaceae bacterium]|nr:type transport system ATP-binding protein [Frankiaceae bacterium]
MMNTDSAAITVDELVVDRAGTRVLPGLSLQVPSGRITGLLGPSGSGKTTLLRAIMGVQLVTSGSVTVLGLPAGHRELRSTVGYVTQADAVYLDLSVRENLQYFAAIAGASPGRVDEVLEVVALGELSQRRVDQLSGGQRSRVSLAAALLGRPQLLVLDEPTVGLDPLLRHDLWQLFRELTQDGVTLLVSSHVMDEAARCDQLVLLLEGRVIAAEPPKELLARTGEPDLEAAFLSLVRKEAVR